MYSVDLGRFVGRDPIGYRGGMGLYSGYFAVGGTDPLGLAIWACCDIEDYLREHVVEFTRTDGPTIFGKYKYVFFGEPTAGTLEGEILNGMLASPREFWILDDGNCVTLPNLKKHVEAREKVVALAKAGTEPPKCAGCKHASQYIQLLASGRPKESLDKMPADAPDDWRDLFGPGADIEGLWNMDVNIDDPINPDDWIPGDAGYVLNLNWAAPRSKAWMGEHIIYGGGGLYGETGTWYGAGISPTSLDALIRWMKFVPWATPTQVNSGTAVEGALQSWRSYPRVGVEKNHR